MTPAVARGYVRNQGLAYAEVDCQDCNSFSGCAALANDDNVGSGQFRLMMALAAQRTFGVDGMPISVTEGRAPFASHVLLVVGVGASKQMNEADARRIVAMMTGQFVVAQRNTFKSENVPMGADRLPRAGFESTVPLVVRSASPDPAWAEFGANDGAVLVDLGPEPLWCSGVRTVQVAGARTESAMPRVHPIAVGREQRAANKAGDKKTGRLGAHLGPPSVVPFPRPASTGAGDLYGAPLSEPAVDGRRGCRFDASLCRIASLVDTGRSLHDQASVFYHTEDRELVAAAVISFACQRVAA